MKALRICAITLAIIGLAAAAVAGAGTVYGKGVTLEETVAIGELLGNPEPYVGKTVRVDGVITGVCKMRGCWVMVSDPESGQGIRIKVEDGVIVFPPESMGHKASAEGVFEVTYQEGEHAGHGEGAEHAEAEKAEQGHVCSEDANKKVIIQIAGTGALIFE